MGWTTPERHQRAKMVVVINPSEGKPSMRKSNRNFAAVTRVGLDLNYGDSLLNTHLSASATRPELPCRQTEPSTSCRALFSEPSALSRAR